MQRPIGKTKKKLKTSESGQLSADQKNFKKAIEFKGYTYYSAEYLRNEGKWKLIFGEESSKKYYYVEATTAIHLIHKISQTRNAKS